MSKQKKQVSPAMYDVIRYPIVTEKTSVLGEYNQVTFAVSPEATKSQVKDAVSTLFGVEVSKVNMVNVKGKVKRYRGRLGKRNGLRKAIVTVPEGQSIDITATL